MEPTPAAGERRKRPPSPPRKRKVRAEVPPAPETASAPAAQAWVVDPLPYAARAERYARDVLEGRVVAGRFVKAACQRHLDDLARAAADPSWEYAFDESAAARPCAFIELLPHIKGDWARPTVRDGFIHAPRIVLEDWEVFLVAVAFGWVFRESGLRRFRRVYLEIARKNGKSILAAGLALFMLCADREPGAEVYVAATKRDQAKIVWDVARQMVLRERDFSSLGVGYNTKAIFQDNSGSKCEPLGRDSDSIDGLNTHCFVCDEMHAWKDRKLYDVLDSSTGARSQALGIGITTSGYDRGGVCYELRSYLVRILNTTLLKHGGMGYHVQGDGQVDERFFGLIYTLDSGYADDRPDDDWADESVWLKANPNLGVSVSIDELRASCTKAKNSPQSQAEFRTKHCNQWLAAESSYMPMERWARCADPTLTPEAFAGESCIAGLDAAFKTDVFAKVKVFRRGEHYYAFGRYWLPQSQVDAKENPLFWGWAQQKLIEVVPGEVVDIELVREDLAADRELHQLTEVPYDPLQLTQFATEMIEDGYPMVEIRPSVMNFSEPMKKLLELVLQGRFHHNGDPVLDWMMSNVVCHRDAKDCIYPRKPEGQEAKRKIDGAIALIMALARTIANEPRNAMPEDHVPTAA